MPVRVCMVVNNLDVGGLEKVVLSLLRHLPESEVETSLLCLSGPGKLMGEVRLPPERVLVLEKPAEMTIADRLRTPAVMLRVARFLRERRVDVVHPHNLAPLVFAGAAARLLGGSRPRVVYSEHNQINRASARAKERFRRWYVRLADEVVAVSDDLRRILVDGLHVPRPVRVVHNGIEAAGVSAADAAALRRELGAGDGDFLVGTAVVLSEQKGIRYLLEAARLVRAADPGVRFVIAGDGPLRGELERTAAAMDLGEGVRFLGYRNDVPRLISALDTYVLSSLWEGLPLALLEALAGGKPVVCTTVGGNPEIVVEGENGLLVPPRDPEAIARAVLTVRRDAALRARMAQANPARFARCFSIASMTRAHVELYRELAAQRSPGPAPAGGAVTPG
jgi:glycosyltransferase involved in cell wall biosynthesis